MTETRKNIQINGYTFQITYYSNNGTYLVAVEDWWEFRVLYMRNTFKTMKWALRRCEEYAK
jgi:peptidoglycan hydrolase-like amidase